MKQNINPAKIEIRPIEDAKSFEHLRGLWNSLLQTNPIQDIFLTWEWLFAWWSHYGSGKELRLITAWIGEDLVGIAPLMLYEKKKYGYKFRVLCNLGTPDSDVGGFIIRNGEPQFVESICNYLAQNSKQWDALELNQFPQNNPDVSILTSTFKNARFAISARINQHFYIPFEGDWNIFINSRSKNLRHALKRSLKRAEETGKVSYKRFIGQDVNDQHLLTIFEINEYGQYPHVYRSQEEKAFLYELLKLMVDRDWLDVQFLYIDEIPVAYQFGFNYNNRFEDWRCGFDRRYSKLSVGKILLKLSLEDNFRRRIQEVDFLRGDEFYKAEWQPFERPHMQLNIVASNNYLALMTFKLLPETKVFFMDWFNKMKRRSNT